jgi:sugar phosphate isomerase/epimerase
MQQQTLNRREILKWAGAAAGTSLLPRVVHSVPSNSAKASLTYCLNMATIRGHNLGFVKELQTASKAGFRSVEIWMDSLQTYLDKGGTLQSARKILSDLGITVENTIGFAAWIVDDDAKRAKGIDQLKREMEMLAQIGCKRVAAPPMGATEGAALDLNQAAERYRSILELGQKTGVVPHLELWGFSKNLSKVSEVMYVAVESGHPSARVLLDTYHIFKGGSSLDTLHMVSTSAVELFHVNDYSAKFERSVITDADRIYPGDGVAPISRILKQFVSPQRPLIISLEVFNKTYYSHDPLTVAKTALAKMKSSTKGIS